MSSLTYSGQVYFVTCGQYVKIGFSSGDLKQRFAGMFSGRLVVPEDIDRTQPLVLLHTIPGCVRRDEARLHDLFARYHVIGEWYSLTPAFVRQLARLQFVTDYEVLSEFRRCRRELKRARLRRAAA